MKLIMSDAITRARQQIKRGHIADARRTLRGVLQQDPQNARAWALMVYAAETPEHALECAERVLHIKPGDPWAMRQRTRLMDALDGLGTRTPTLRQPPVPSMEQYALRFLWEALRSGVNMLVVAPEPSLRAALVAAIAERIPADRYPVRMRRLRAVTNPTNRTPHHIMPTLTDDEVLGVLAWVHRTGALLVAGISAETPEQAISRCQFAATMHYRTAERHIKRQLAPEQLGQVLAAVFPLVVAGQRQGDDALITAVVEPTPTPSGQVNPRTLFHMEGGLLKPTGLHPTWLVDYPLAIEMPPAPTPPPQPTPLSQPTPRTDLSHQVLTRHTTRPTFDDEPNALLKAPPPPAPRQSGLPWRLLVLVGAAGLLALLLVVLIALSR